jgi:hypothetical protein
MRPDPGSIFVLLKWPLFGALFAGGVLAVAYYFGPDRARELGDAGGQGFAEGVNRFQRQIASVSGERGCYRR